MKKKQFMSKLAALTMAAAMGLTAVPSTVFAQTVAVEQSEATVTAAMLTLKQGDTEVKSGDLYNALTTSEDILKLDNTTWTNDTVKAAVEKVSVEGQTIDNVAVTGATAKSASATVTFDYSDSKSYTLTIDVVSTKDLTELTKAGEDGKTVAVGQNLADAIDDYFGNEDNEFRTYAGETLNSATVLNAYKTQAAKSGSSINTAASAADTLSDAKVSLSAFSVTGDDFTATLTWTTNTVVYNYSFSGTVAASKDSKAEKVDAAVAVLQANPVADKGTEAADAETEKSYIEGLLNDALDDDDINVTLTLAKNGETNLYTPAEHGKNGSITVFVTGASNPNAAVTFTLKESSKAKLAEAKEELTKATNFGNTTTDIYVKNDADTKDAAGKLYTIESTKKFARGLQAKTATEAVDADTVKAGVEKLVSDAVSKFGDDGVTYTTELVSAKYGSVSGSETTDPVTKATTLAEGSYLVKVTASIANDFYKKGTNGAETKDKTSKNVYYVLVETPTLKEVKTTGITLSNQNVVLNLNKDYSDLDKDKGTDAMVIDITPTLTPEGANGSITWSIEKAVGSDGKTDLTTKGDDYKFAVDADNHTAGSQTVGTAAQKLVVKEAGTYTVKAVYDGDVEATATITVTSNFKDVPTGAYYGKAVSQAFKAGIAEGIGDGKFDPNGDVTRGQFVTFLYRYAVKADPSVEIKDADVKETFSDVPTTSYYAKAVQWASANKIALGTGDGKFDPDAKVTRGQAVTFIYRAKSNPDTGASGAQYENTTRFTDLTAGSYYVAPVTWGVNNSVVSGLSTTEFGPEQTASRAQAITFIARAYTDNGNGIFTGIDKAANR